MNRYIFPTENCSIKIVENAHEMLAIVIYDHHIDDEEVKWLLNEVLEDLFLQATNQNSTYFDNTDALNVYEAIEDLYFHYFGADESD